MKLRLKIVCSLVSLSLVLAIRCHAITTSGIITGAETWSGRVFLTGDVTVGPNGQLTIMPGTRVESDPLADDQLGGEHSSRIELIVDGGILIARGTTDAPIVFSSAALKPSTGDWYGIILRSNNATITYTFVEYAKVGLSIWGPISGSGPILEDDGVWNCNFGIWCERSVSLRRCSIRGTVTGDAGIPYSQIALGIINPKEVPCLVTMSDCVIADNATIGVYGGGGILNLSRTLVARNVAGIEAPAFLDGGVRLCPGSGNTYDHCYVLANSGVGLLHTACTTGASSQASLLRDTVVRGNESDGVNLSDGAWSITNSEIENNGLSGVSASYSIGLDSAPSLAISGSIISENPDAGLLLRTPSSGITDNLFQRNWNAIRVAYPPGTPFQGIVGNDFIDSGIYDLNVENGTAVGADGNYWGTVTTEELVDDIRPLSRIVDSHDNPALGQVAIRNWKTNNLFQPTLPRIVTPPLSMMTPAGETARLDVGAISALPLSYQWFKDGIPISGATEMTLTILKCGSADAGNYSVQVLNDLGNSLSESARLIVLADPNAAKLAVELAGPDVVITLSGRQGIGYTVQFSDILSTSTTWQTLSNFTLKGSSLVLKDAINNGRQQTYYRAISQ